MDKNPITPTPEQIEKMAEEYVGDEPSIGTTHALEMNIRDLWEADRESFLAGAHAMQPLMDAQAAKAEKAIDEISHHLEDIEHSYKRYMEVGKEKIDLVKIWPAVSFIRAELTKWRTK